MGWQWHQLNYMQIIYTSFQTDYDASTSSLKFVTYRLLFLMLNQQHQSPLRQWHCQSIDTIRCDVVNYYIYKERGGWKLDLGRELCLCMVQSTLQFISSVSVPCQWCCQSSACVFDYQLVCEKLAVFPYTRYTVEFCVEFPFLWYSQVQDQSRG